MHTASCPSHLQPSSLEQSYMIRFSVAYLTILYMLLKMFGLLTGGNKSGSGS